MSTKTHIRSVLEDYLNLESALADFAKAKEEAMLRYNQVLCEHDKPGYNYNLHTATPVIEAWDKIKLLEKDSRETAQKLAEADKTIREYIHVLNSHPLEVQFMYDSLNHHNGVHTFYVENGALKVMHAAPR